MKNYSNRKLSDEEISFIEFLKSKEETLIIQENKVILKVKENLPYKVGVARCNPNDKFDIKIGYRVAKLDLKKKEQYEILSSIDSDIEKLEKIFKKQKNALMNKRLKTKNKISQIKHEANNISFPKEPKSGKFRKKIDFLKHGLNNEFCFSTEQFKRVEHLDEAVSNLYLKFYKKLPPLNYKYAYSIFEGSDFVIYTIRPEWKTEQIVAGSVVDGIIIYNSDIESLIKDF